MEIYLHIGLEKTGTTTVQEFLALNRLHLLKNGYLFPLAAGKTSQTRLAAYAIDDAKNDGIRKGHVGELGSSEFDKRFRDEMLKEVDANPCERMILSSEHCSSRLTSKQEIEKLKRLLDEIGVTKRIVVYLRRQDDLLVSSYAEMINNGVSAPFGFPNPQMLQSRYNYNYLTSLWAEVFGGDIVFPRVFERGAMKGGDLLQDFSDAMGIIVEGMNYTVGNYNTSLSALAIEYLRNINKHFSPDVRTPHLQHAVVGLLSKLFPGPSFSLGYDDRQKFLSRFAESNRHLANRYFPERDGLLFSPVPEDVRDVPLPQLQLDDFLKMFAQMIVAMND